VNVPVPACPNEDLTQPEKIELAASGKVQSLQLTEDSVGDTAKAAAATR